MFQDDREGTDLSVSMCFPISERLIELVLDCHPKEFDIQSTVSTDLETQIQGV